MVLEAWEKPLHLHTVPTKGRTTNWLAHTKKEFHCQRSSNLGITNKSTSPTQLSCQIYIDNKKRNRQQIARDECTIYGLFAHSKHYLQGPKWFKVRATNLKARLKEKGVSHTTFFSMEKAGRHPYGGNSASIYIQIQVKKYLINFFQEGSEILVV